MEKLKNNFWQDNRLIIKAIFIGILTLLLLIPMAFISELVREREQRHDQTLKEVSGKWAAAQTLVGPILVIPYRHSYTDEKNHLLNTTRQAYFLPQTLEVKGTILPEKRHRGIYEAILYRSDLQITGKFSRLDPADLKVPMKDWLPHQAYLIFGMSDMRGIENRLALQWNDSLKYFNPGMPENDVLKQGVYVPLSLDRRTLDSGDFNFFIRLQIKGSGALDIVPLGKSTEVVLHSPWNTPSFAGNFLPDAHQISKKGFKARWKIFNLNRNLPQHWTQGNYDLEASKFGVSLVQPVDMYQKTMRCVKYAILIIALTFIVFFLVENAQNNLVHPFQYILVGFALCIFYTLLISLSEYLHFSLAYGISTLATAGLISLYTSWLFRNKKVALFIGLALLLLYGFIFMLVELKDFSLLFGSMGLFVILAMLMWFTRRINRKKFS